jgi:hypothetical protein
VIPAVQIAVHAVTCVAVIPAVAILAVAIHVAVICVAVICAVATPAVATCAVATLVAVTLAVAINVAVQTSASLRNRKAQQVRSLQNTSLSKSLLKVLLKAKVAHQPYAVSLTC